ncbi:ABC transporter permease, partial [Phocaeicola sp.]
MNTLKYAWRFLTRSKSYTVINLLGLAFSLACCIILMRYIHRELTVDTHCIDREHVYATYINMEGSRGLSSINQRRDSTLIDKRHIESQTSYIPLEQDYVISGTNRFPARCIVTDSVFFQFFRYPVVQGNYSLRSPQSALLTESFARKIFGRENPIGKVLRYANGKDITIEGILGEPECKTSIHFDVVLSSSLSDSWGRASIGLYRFMPGTDMDALNKVGSEPRYLNNPAYDTRTYTFAFISLKDIYWDGSLTKSEPSMFSSGSSSHITILSGVCLLLLFTGVLNFVNIYLVVMLRRGKEYGLKKVFGSHGRSLFLQIWMENSLLVLSALLIAWFIIEVTYIPVEHLFNYHFAYTAFDGWLSIGILLLLPLVTSIYPYIKYNYTPPILSIRSIARNQHSIRSRMVFLSVQYILTFLLVVLSLYFNRQLEVLLHTEPGFRTKDILIANLVYESKDFNSYTYETMEQDRQRTTQLKNELKACPLIEQYEACLQGILTPSFGTNYINEQGKKVFLDIWRATPNFFDMYNIKLVEGSFSNLDDDDSSTIIVVNRAAMKALGYTSIQGAGIVEEDRKRANANAAFQPIVAVVEDYYGGHLSLGVQPTIYKVDKNIGGNTYQIAYAPGKKKEVIDFLRKLELKIYGCEDFEYTLLEDDVKAIYAQDRQTATIYSLFACIAIIISGLGLFGIALFDIRQRYREIAIRKVNGAGIRDLYLLLFRKYILVLAGAFVLAAPLSYYLIYMYTRDFVVKAPIGIGIFVIALLIVMLISLGTLMWQIRKA